MHEPVIESLEELLSGGQPSAAAEKHLSECTGCRESVTAMKSHSALFSVLKDPHDVEISPAFYTRVMNRIEVQSKPSIWNLFGESLFAKRLAYGSATFLLLVGSWFASYEQSENTFASSDAGIVLAGEHQPEPVTMDPQRDRDVILVNLATYQQD